MSMLEWSGERVFMTNVLLEYEHGNIYERDSAKLVSWTRLLEVVSTAAEGRSKDVAALRTMSCDVYDL